MADDLLINFQPAFYADAFFSFDRAIIYITGITLVPLTAFCGLDYTVIKQWVFARILLLKKDKKVWNYF